MWLRLELAQVARLRNHLPWILAVVFTSPRSSPRFLHTFNIDNNHLLPLPLPFRNNNLQKFIIPPFAQNPWITIHDLCVSSFFHESFNENSNHKENLKIFNFFSRAKSFVPLAKNFQKLLFIPRCRNLSFTFPRLYTVLTSIPTAHLWINQSVHIIREILINVAVENDDSKSFSNDHRSFSFPKRNLSVRISFRTGRNPTKRHLIFVKRIRARKPPRNSTEYQPNLQNQSKHRYPHTRILRCIWKKEEETILRNRENSSEPISTLTYIYNNRWTIIIHNWLKIESISITHLD